MRMGRSWEGRAENGLGAASPTFPALFPQGPFLPLSRQRVGQGMGNHLLLVSKVKSV